MLKNNLTPEMSKVRMDRFAGGVSNIKNTKYLKAEIMKEMKRAKDFKETPYITIAGERWRINNCSFGCERVELYTAGIHFNITFWKPQPYSYSLYFDISGTILAYNNGKEIIREIIRSLEDDYGVEVIDSAKASIISIDICCDLDIPIDNFLKIVKPEYINTKLKKEGEIYTDVTDLSNYSNDKDDDPKVLPYDFTELSKDDEGIETVTFNNDMNQTKASVNMGKRNENQGRIYNKDADCQKKGKPKLYNGNYKYCTRFECSLDVKALRTFIKPNGGKIETYDDAEEMLDNIFYTFFTTTIVAKPEYSKQWSKITDWMSNPQKLKRGTKKKQHNPMYDMNKDKIQFNRKRTMVKNTIQLLLQHFNTVQEMFELLDDILMCPKDSLGESGLFKAWVERRNKNYGDISCDPKVAATQIRDGLFTTLVQNKKLNLSSE